MKDICSVLLEWILSEIETQRQSLFSMEKLFFKDAMAIFLTCSGMLLPNMHYDLFQQPSLLPPLPPQQPFVLQWLLVECVFSPFSLRGNLHGYCFAHNNVENYSKT